MNHRKTVYNCRPHEKELSHLLPRSRKMEMDSVPFGQRKMKADKMTKDDSCLREQAALDKQAAGGDAGKPIGDRDAPLETLCCRCILKVIRERRNLQRTDEVSLEEQANNLFKPCPLYAPSNVCG